MVVTAVRASGSRASRDRRCLSSGDSYRPEASTAVRALSFQGTDRFFGRPHPQRLVMKLPFWVGIVVVCICCQWERIHHGVYWLQEE